MWNWSCLTSSLLIFPTFIMYFKIAMMVTKNELGNRQNAVVQLHFQNFQKIWVKFYKSRVLAFKTDKNFKSKAICLFCIESVFCKRDYPQNRVKRFWKLVNFGRKWTELWTNNLKQIFPEKENQVLILFTCLTWNGITQYLSSSNGLL